MDVRRTGWLIVCAALLLAGCRRQQFVNSYIETINNTNRELEDKVLDLEYENEILKQTNEDLKKKNEGRGSRKSSSSSDSGESRPRLFSPGKRPPAMGPEDDLAPPEIKVPEIKTPDEPARPAIPETPKIDIPVDPPADPTTAPARGPAIKLDQPAPSEVPPRRSTFPPPADVVPDPEDVLPSPAKSSRTSPPPLPERRTPTSTTNTGPTFVPPSRARPAVVEPPPAPPAEDLTPPKRTPLPEPTSSQTPAASLGPVAKLHLNPLHTGGEDADGRPGDEGVSLLLEPQDVTGNFVAAAGKVSVVVLDPQLEGTAARVARWDIDEAKVKNSLKTVATNRGIELHLLWSDKRPQNNRLRLYVRMELADGNKLQTDREIFVTLPGEISDRWTPRKGEDLARQPRTTLAEPKMVPENAVTTPRSEVIPQPLPREEKPAQPEPAIAEPAVPLAEPAAPMPSRANTRPKSKLIMPPPALGESP